MNPQDYTPEQQKDIQERVEKAKVILAELNLQPGTLVFANNIGDDVFGMKAVAYLQDTKYSNVVSPIQHEHLQKD